MDSIDSSQSLKRGDEDVSALLYDSISSRTQKAYFKKYFSILFRNDIYVFLVDSASNSVRIVTSLLRSSKRSEETDSGLKKRERGSIFS